MKLNKKILLAITSIVLSLGLVSCAKTTIDPSTSDEQGLSSQSSNTTNSVVVETIADLNSGIRLGCQSGTIAEDWFSKNIKNSPVNVYKSNDALVNDLSNSNIDAIIVDEWYAKYIVENNSQLQITNIKFPIQEYGFAFKKGNDELRRLINESLDVFIQDGTIDSLTNNYMPTQGDVVLPDKISSSNDSTRTVRVGTSPDFYPFEYYVDDVLYGFDISLLEKIAEYYSWNIEFVDMDFNLLALSLDTGEVDMLASGITISDERNQIIDFSNDYFNIEQVVVTRK